MMIEICVIGSDDNDHWYFHSFSTHYFIIICILAGILAYFSFNLCTIGLLAYILSYINIRL